MDYLKEIFYGLSFKGRITRQEFLIRLIIALLGFAFGGFYLTNPNLRTKPFWSLFLVIYCFLYCTAIIARRLHDLGLTGWLSILNIVVFLTFDYFHMTNAGYMFEFVFYTALLTIKGLPSDNKYGPNPYETKNQ